MLRGLSAAVLALGVLILLSLFVALPPAAASAPDTGWRGEYFANPDLSGKPVLTRSSPKLDFNWGLGSPDPRLPADHFSARWTRSIHLPAGQYRFSASVDDGVRLYVDGKPVIDQWRITAPITYTSSLALPAGTHDLRVEYYENTERAQIKVWWDQSTQPPVNAAAWQPPHQSGAWRGSYYDNRSLSGDPKFERDDVAIYFDWGEAGPGGGIGGQDFSVRWHRVVDFPGGPTQFKVTADDAVRVWLDWKTIINEWHESPGQTYTTEMDVKPGSHEIAVEYFQGAGTARVQLEWQDANVDWAGNLTTCMRPYDSWIKVYRLAPNNSWEDLKEAGYGPIAQDGGLDLFGLPVSAFYGWAGQPYKVELWMDGRQVRSEGDVLAGQPVLALQPGGAIRTSWPCGASLPR